MSRPRQEEFILDVRRSARALQKPKMEVYSDAADTDEIAKILHRAGQWLTPKVVEHYSPDDFSAYQAEQQERLRLGVEEFRKIAGQVTPYQPASVEQFMKGAPLFRELTKALGSIVLSEWLSAIDSLEKQAEKWSAQAEWRTRRVMKPTSESLIGSYEAPQLLIFAEPNLFVLDPIARFVPGSQGAFDFAIQPSYNTTSMYRDDSGIWYVHLDLRNGVANGRRVEWNRDTFNSCIEQLRAFV